MRTLLTIAILTLVISIFISCEKNNPESSDSMYSYLSEPDFIKEGLVGYYPFNGDVKDFSGNEYEITAQNPTFTIDRNNALSGALHFDGIDDYILLPNLGQLFLNNQGTIIFWVKSDTLDLENNQTQSAILSIVDSVNTSFILGSGRGYLEYSFGNYPNFGGGSIGSAVEKNNFEFYAMSITENGIILYNYEDGLYKVNSRSNPEYSFGFASGRKNQDIFIGKSIVESADGEVFDKFFTYFKGEIDDLIIYDRILTEDEIKYFFNLEAE